MVASAPSIGEPSRPPNASRLLGSSERDRLAFRQGERRTVFFSRKVGDGYMRTGQYMGEWKDNKYHGKGTLELNDGTRYVGSWKDGKRHGMGTLWIRGPDGKLRKEYGGEWEDDIKAGRGARRPKPCEAACCARREWRGVRAPGRRRNRTPFLLEQGCRHCSTARPTMGSGAAACGTAWASAPTLTAEYTRESGSTTSDTASASSTT